MTEVFKTQDLYLAGALQATGHQLLEIVPEDENGRVSWVFGPSESLGEVIDEYWGRRLKVNALTYAENLRNLKTQIFSIRR